MAQVILLHGLHMHAWAMRPLANQLLAYGFDCHRFGYYSMLHTLPVHSKRLNHWLEQHFDLATPLNFVGHSLGGLLIRDFLYRYPNWQIGRCVTLGTPHLGSLSADKVQKILPTFIGQSYRSGLDGNVPMLIDGIELGSIAGNVSAGLGKLVLPRDGRENDGTVYIDETRLPNATDHIILPASHTGMILNKQVAKQVAYFLQHGHFLH